MRIDDHKGGAGFNKKAAQKHREKNDIYADMGEIKDDA